MQIPPGVENQFLWRLALQLERLGIEKPAAKLYRKALNPAFRHNFRCGPGFDISIENKSFVACLNGEPVVSGAVVTQAAPFNRPCLILGSGPSINDIEDRYFHECDLIATNGAILKCVEKGVQAKVHLVQDPNFIETSFGLFEDSLSATHRLVLSAHAIAAIAHRKPSLLAQCPVDLLERVNRAFCQPRLSPAELTEWCRQQPDIELSHADAAGAIGWSHNPVLGVFTGSTVAFSALQLAVGAGYRNIYLGGVDFTSGTNGGRFYREKSRAAISHLDKNFETKILPSFSLGSDILKRLNVRFYNLSIDCRLPKSFFDGL